MINSANTIITTTTITTTTTIMAVIISITKINNHTSMITYY